MWALPHQLWGSTSTSLAPLPKSRQHCRSFISVKCGPESRPRVWKSVWGGLKVWCVGGGVGDFFTISCLFLFPFREWNLNLSWIWNLKRITSWRLSLFLPLKMKAITTLFSSEPVVSIACLPGSHGETAPDSNDFSKKYIQESTKYWYETRMVRRKATRKSIQKSNS